MTNTEATVRDVREGVVREHMESENRHDYGATMATFGHPRYELIASGEVFDGVEDVTRYFARSRAAFPDQRNELISIRHADDAVVTEFTLRGTHLGELYGIAPTGREFACRMVAIFLFEGDRLVCERVYYDMATIMHQLGLGPS